MYNVKDTKQSMYIFMYIKNKNVKGSHKTQPVVWPRPHACAQPITLAVAAMHSCFGLVRPHKHGIAVGQRIYIHIYSQ